MKKLKLLLLLPILLLSSCDIDDNKPHTPDTNKHDEYYVLLCEHHTGDCEYLKFYHDTYTDNIYYTWTHTSGYGVSGNMSPYYNKDGNIMKYSEFIKVHKH